MMKCPNCGSINDDDAQFCENCGTHLQGTSSGGTANSTQVLLVAVIVLVALLSFAVGYNFFNNPKNQTMQMNDTIKNGTNIPYSSEYITFDKVKSIALQNAAAGVLVSEPTLLKNEAGQAIYVCYYYYQGRQIGGIIIDAKTGDVLYKEHNLPSNYNQNNNNNQNNGNTNNNNNNNNNGGGYKICPTCGGDRVVPSQDGENWIKCPTCGGAGFV